MLYFHKIGYANYFKNGKVVDKNGGLFEFEIVRAELSKVNVSSDILVIVNGKFADLHEEQALLEKMTTYSGCIFIATDVISFTENINIMSNCDYILHQCPNLKLPSTIRATQYYSYLPEAFYNYVKRKSVPKDDILVFGGGYRDNKRKINKYLKSVCSKAFVKSKTTDTRKQYEEYLDELAACKYSLIISRKKYQKLGWVTPRYVEAIANDTLPICDNTYDKYYHYGNIVRVSSVKELQRIVLLFSETKIEKLLRHAKLDVSMKSGMFKSLITHIGEEYDNCRHSK